MKRANGKTGKRLWSKESAAMYIGNVSHGHAKTGLTYWSAQDFLSRFDNEKQSTISK
jgi:hypothetical protein